MKSLITSKSIRAIALLASFTSVHALLSMSAAGSSAWAADVDENVTTLYRAPTQVFAPVGFDSDDNVQIVLTGGFGNFCYHTAPAVVTKDLPNGKIYIQSTIYNLNHCVDAMMYIPYSQTVDLGIISAGSYEVMVTDNNGTYQQRAKIDVTQSRPSPYSPDDYLYAPISEVSFQPALNGQAASVTLRGSFSNSCMSLGAVIVHANTGNVIEIQPMADLIQNSSCQPSVTPFTKTVSLPSLPAGDVLLHVRSMGGQSVNRVVTLMDRLDPK